MTYIVQAPTDIKTGILLPASKSISNRALILKALSKSPFSINNLSDCDDTEVMANAFAFNKREINIKAAGTSMRFLTAYLSQLEGKEYTITGTERMKNRPIKILVDALRNLGAEIDYVEKEGYPPLKIKGRKLEGGTVVLNGGVSSQYISALMMIAPLMTNGLTLHLEGAIISRPYIRMTIDMMRDFGIQTQWEENVIRIEPQNYQPTPYEIESDWSAASYWYQIFALFPNESEISLYGLRKKSSQGDAAIASLFEKLGVTSQYTASGVVLQKSNQIVSELEYDFVNEPDMAQTFVVTCCLMNIPFRFSGLQTLRIKETDRIAALQLEMNKLGYLLSDSDNNILEWNGERCEPRHQPAIDTYEDHRMAMAFAPAALHLGEIAINDPEVVSKSYPNFWKDLEQVGFTIMRID